MSLLFQGDRFPSVTTSQILLRRHNPQSVIKADGIFGPRTAGAVREFQKFHRLTQDGKIGKNTWGAFTAVSRFETIDVVDGTDPSLIAFEAADLRAAGFDPIIVFGMSNGVDVVMNAIANKASAGNVMLLRFHGHGNKGLQNVTGGEIDGAPHLAGISVDNFDQVKASLAKITDRFVQFGSVQMLGCEVGGGKGPILMRRLADTWGVPVTAGRHTQFAGGSATFRFEGTTVTGFPGGASLAGWAQAMETAHGNVSMST
ncbi:peptidoglycan-binding domain-containing protein [Phreatobacter stygius]|uniref:Peptidoglycan-binding protein n=1 Tax=Phreatobacter stygius TaxID=1940610 RepID=A0A4D7B9Q4_9HYPH|nr:peptidoglycan-binding domain-containing protein [Phreatobacter stygius]QCI67300.1 peptidoglycan-binding protein [Phreatobacter stygius]